jgi:hypothetical protein
MKLVHYSSPYQILATKAEETLQRIFECSGDSFEIAESESNGIAPKNYFEHAFLYPMSAMYERHALDDESDQNVRQMLAELKRYIISKLEEITIEITNIHDKYVELVSKIIPKENARFATKQSYSDIPAFIKKLKFYAGEPANTLCLKASCQDISMSINLYVESESESDTDEIESFVKNFNSYLLATE